MVRVRLLVRPARREPGVLSIALLGAVFGCAKADLAPNGGPPDASPDVADFLDTNGSTDLEDADANGNADADQVDLEAADDVPVADVAANTGDAGSAEQPAECTGDPDCPGMDEPCRRRSCLNGVCGFASLPAGTVTALQVSGDCHVNQCDGSGMIVAVTDDGDTPIDGKSCTMDICQNGVPSNPPVATGTSCTDNGGMVCGSNAECIIGDTFFVLRVGDGAGALSAGATATFVEERRFDGTVVRVIALPTVPSGQNRRFAQSGTARSDGHLARSADGHYLTLAGYDAPIGSAGVVGSAVASVNRVVARIDAAGTVDTSTVLGNAFDANNVRGAVTSDGTGFWVAGANGGASGGVQWVALGGTMGTSITSNLSNARALTISDGQLFGSSGKPPFDLVFAIGSGLPTVSTFAVSLRGSFIAGGSPEGVAFMDLDSAVPGPDRLYVADDRDPVAGGGIQKWAFDGRIWTSSQRFGASGFRGLAAIVKPTAIWLIASTADTNGGNSLIAFVDTGAGVPVGIQVARVDGVTTVFRGVSIAPN